MRGFETQPDLNIIFDHFLSHAHHTKYSEYPLDLESVIEFLDSQPGL